MLHRTVRVLNRAKLVTPEKCVQITRLGLGTNVKCRRSELTGQQRMLTTNIGKIDKSDTQKNAVKVFLGVAEALLALPKGQNFGQAITDYKQRIIQSGTQIDHEILELAVKKAVENDRFNLVPHILRVGWWLCISIPPTLYENICSLLLVNRQWDTLRVLLRLCNEHVAKPTTKFLNIRLRTYLHSEYYSKLQMAAVKQMFSKAECTLDGETFNIMIEASVANRDMAACRQTVVQMTREGFQINEETHHAILVRMVAMGPNQALETAIFTSLQGMNPSHDISILNSLIRLRSIARDDAMLQGYLRHLQVRRPQAGTSSASAPYWNINPDISTISILIEHFARRRQLKAALQAFDLVSLLKLDPSPEIVAHTINAYGRCGRIQEALALAAGLSRSLPPTRQEQAHLLLRRLGWDGVETIHDISKVAANVYIFNALLKTVIGKGGLESVAIVLDLMEAHYVAPDDDTAAVCLHFLDRFKKTNSNDIIAILYRFSQHPLNWRQRHVNVVMHAILREHKILMFGTGGWKGASVFSGPNRERSLPNNLHPSTSRRAENIFGIMNGTKQPEDAYNTRLRSILETVDTSGARQDHATYSIRMFYHARISRDVGAVEDLYRDMLSNDLLPNAYHIAALMEAFCITDQVERAQQVLLDAIAEGIPINRVLYTILIRAYGNRGDPTSAFRAYQEMMRNNVRPDIVALDAVIRSYFMVKEYDLAKRTLFQLWETVLPPYTLPPSSASLGDAMSRLRSLENVQRPVHERHNQKEVITIKEITKKWRRTSAKKKFKATPSALRSLISLEGDHGEVGAEAEVPTQGEEDKPDQ